MTLIDKQQLFAELAARLILHAIDQGYQVTLGHAERSREEAVRLGFPNSNHTRRLAIDLNLFRNGRYLGRSEDHQPLGEWWKTRHPLCRWGGDFSRPDGNHYSLEHEGVR